jgi:ABC-2 type transport system permease protein
MRMEDFTGTGKLARLIIRRDWKLLLAWALVISLYMVVVITSFIDLYTTPQMIAQFVAETNSSLAEVALVGKILSPTLGALIAWKAGLPMYIIGGLASFLAVIKYTRTEEDKGRLELVSSMAVGKYSGLTAALIVTFAINLIIAALAIVILLGFGISAAGSIAFALSIAVLGCFFASVGGITSQVCGSTGPARAFAGGILALAYLLRMVADGASISWLSWFTPAGWMEQVQAYSGNNWWIFALFIVAIAALTAVAFMISSRRDMGTGLTPQRPGPATASPGLRNSLSLAWRLQRGMLFAFMVMFIVCGVLIGFITKTAADQMSTNPQFMELLTRVSGNAPAGDSFFNIFLVILGFVATIYAVMAALKMRSEENEMHADVILATPVNRIRWAAGHVAIALAGTAFILMVFGLVAGVVYGVSMGNVGNELPRVFLASLAYLPAIWIIAGIAVALFGLLPRLTILSWGVLVVCMLIEVGGDIKVVGTSIMGVSPFDHVPMVLAGDNSILPLAGLVILAAVLIAAGLIGFQRRDISS